MTGGDGRDDYRAFEAEELVGRLHALFEELGQYPDSEVRERALDLAQLILGLYGEALRRVVGTIDALQQRVEVFAQRPPLRSAARPVRRAA